MKRLLITWQRLIDNDKTCPRCEGTEKELHRAFEKISKALSYLGIKVILEKQEISIDEFKVNTLRSNQIWINNKPIEEWLNAKIGSSKCCDVCGDEQCRTIEISESRYEVIPENLIIKASLLAAAEMINNKLPFLMFHGEH